MGKAINLKRAHVRDAKQISMMSEKISDPSRLCIHTVTTKPLSLANAAAAYEKVGVRGITVWRDALEGTEPGAAGAILRDHGLEIVSYCRGGFFPSVEERKRAEALDENRRIIDEAHALGAPLIVLVCGADPGQSLSVSRDQICEGIETILPHAKEAGVRLAIEPLHPMYSDTRSAINTMLQANDACEQIGSDYVGVAVDVYHLWWDDSLEKEIVRCGEAGNLFAFHVCDWRVPTEDLLLDRGLMGEGCIDIPRIRGWVEQAGFRGFNEVEIFSKRYWEMDQAVYLDKIVDAYLNYV